jgi:alpha-glucan,water dikinase
VSHRAFYSLRKVGIEADDVRMAVCVMRVVPARYAFVIHTKNPSNNDANEVRLRWLHPLMRVA